MNSLFFALFVSLFQMAVDGAPSDTSLSGETQLIVDVSSASGCAQKDESGNWYGPDIEVWQAVAHEIGLSPDRFRYQEVPFPKIFTDLEQGQAHLGLSCITATSDRLDRVDFSQPYLDGAGIGVLTKNVKESKASRFFSKDILVNVLFFWFGLWFVLIFLSGIITWRLDPSTGTIAEDFKTGASEGIWGSFATATTIGWGDVAFKVWRVRGFQMAVWLMSTLIIMYGGADLTSSVTVRDLSQQTVSVDDVRGKKIATVASTTSEKLAKSMGANIQTVDNIDVAYGLLASGKVDVVVYDAPALRQHAKQTDGDLVVLRGTLTYEYYSIALPKQSVFKPAIDKAILRIREDGRYEAIMHRWFGE